MASVHRPQAYNQQDINLTPENSGPSTEHLTLSGTHYADTAGPRRDVLKGVVRTEGISEQLSVEAANAHEILNSDYVEKIKLATHEIMHMREKALEASTSRDSHEFSLAR